MLMGKIRELVPWWNLVAINDRPVPGMLAVEDLTVRYRRTSVPPTNLQLSKVKLVS